jgi:hypothetical protein
MAGLAPQTLRESAPESLNLGDGLTVEIEAPPADAPEIDRAGNVVRINHGDGGVTVAIEPGALGNVNKPKTKGWFDNLCDQIPHDERARISEELLRGIADDINSRQEWIEAQTQGMQLLGLKIELPGTQGSADGAPVEGMSKVRHPLLLEAVLRFQANARAEMLPTDGPVKIRDDDNNNGLPEDKLAEAFEKDLNHYLTSTATEYYPDTDRMFLKLGFGGTAFKKVYYCPLRNRPVSETVEAKDLIVGARHRPGQRAPGDPPRHDAAVHGEAAADPRRLPRHPAHHAQRVKAELAWTARRRRSRASRRT